MPRFGNYSALKILLMLCASLSFASAWGQPNVPSANGERRIALVIGNASYAIGALKNPVNDSRAMAAALKDLGFTIIARENASVGMMIDAIREFSLKAKDNQVRLFYYAGHGVQVKGKNYLIPVDANIQTEEDITLKSADVTELLERLGRLQTGLNMVILDACRNNPFANPGLIGSDGRLVRFRGNAPAGLAQLEAPQGTLVAFATAPGGVAMDGNNFSNSLYTKHLLANIQAPGLPVEQLFKRVRIAVAQETKRLQVPWESSSLMGDFCFKPNGDGVCAAQSGR
jgi:uncharacterized caspase-like protein